MEPIYDITKTYAENANFGPFFKGKFPKRPKAEKFFDFFGHRVRSRIGVPAGPLLNSNWVALAAKLGYDIPTYKTIRSDAHPSHQLPNMTYIDENGNQTPKPTNLDKLTVTNSFGMPSKSPDFLLNDIAKANESLAEGQIMIVSIVGTPNRGQSFLGDFVKTALMAKEAGALIIEANFSCPNVKKTDGILYQNPETVHEYALTISKAVHPLPLIIKVGEFESTHQMKSVILAAARGGVRGICGLNSVKFEIHPPLDEHRPSSGVCGAAIRDKAMNFVKEARAIIKKNQLDMTLLGCGGILNPKHFDEFLDAGADFAMTATGMIWNPYLAKRYHEKEFSSF